MNILVTGGTGFIGQALLPELEAAGHHCTVHSRSPRSDAGGRRYVRSFAELDDSPIDAVINLAGESMAGSRWSDRFKHQLRASRIDTTRELVAFMAQRSSRPAVLLSASAIGYYGHQGDKTLDEGAPPVDGFSHSLCEDWEREALAAEPLGVRVCRLRLGVVLDNGGGALTEMRRSFKFGLASWMGSGEQYLSWVHRSDVVQAIVFLLQHSDASGAFNLTAPEPVSHREFAAVLARQHRILLSAPVPAMVARLLLGEMADELLLNGQRVLPAGLQQLGFEFHYPGLEAALAAICERGT